MTQTQTLKLKTLRTGKGEPWLMCQEPIEVSRRKRAGRVFDYLGNFIRFKYKYEVSIEPCRVWCHGLQALKEHLLRVHGKTDVTMTNREYEGGDG